MLQDLLSSDTTRISLLDTSPRLWFRLLHDTTITTIHLHLPYNAP